MATDRNKFKVMLVSHYLNLMSFKIKQKNWRQQLIQLHSLISKCMRHAMFSILNIEKPHERFQVKISTNFQTWIDINVFEFKRMIEKDNNLFYTSILMFKQNTRLKGKNKNTNQKHNKINNKDCNSMKSHLIILVTFVMHLHMQYLILN